VTRAQVALESWEEGLAHLGRCVVAFQQIDEVLNACISAMICRDKQVGSILTVELSFRAKISVYGALFLHRGALTEIPIDVREVIARVHEAEAQRNAYVHSHWDANMKHPGSVKRSKSICRARKGLSRNQEFPTPEELEVQSESFENIAEDLLFVTVEHFPKLQPTIMRTLK
jgi:hypothetical protein